MIDVTVPAPVRMTTSDTTLSETIRDVVIDLQSLTGDSISDSRTVTRDCHGVWT